MLSHPIFDFSLHAQVPDFPSGQFLPQENLHPFGLYFLSSPCACNAPSLSLFRNSTSYLGKKDFPDNS